MDTNLGAAAGARSLPGDLRFLFRGRKATTPSDFIADSIAVAAAGAARRLGICEEVQRGLRSRSFDTGRFSVRRECGRYHFHQLLAQSLNNGGK